MAARKQPQQRRRRTAAAEAGGQQGLSLDREAVRRLRLQRGLTQQALAQQRAQLDGQSVQISYAQVRRIEQDGRAGPATARILAALLGVELAQLRPRDQREAPCGLPREPSVDFVGRRAAVDAVLQILAREGSARIAASVEGLPGIGKTELALQVCAECERSRSHRIFWFDAQRGDLRKTWSDTVAPHLGIENPDPEQRAKLALRAVEALAEPTLVVLDNLEHWSSSQPWPRPQGRHIRWLVTTRISQLGERAFEHVELPVLDAPSAREFVLRIAGPALAQREGFDALLAQLDGYTIALELAAAFLGRFPEVGPNEYLELLLEGKRDVLEEEVKDRTSYQESLDRAFELLWQRLPSSVREAWLLAARFEQERASHALSDACGLSRKRRAQLRDFHLIQADSEGWTMHRLTRDFGRRAGIGEQQQQAREKFLRGCSERACTIEPDNAFRIYALDRPHFDAALAVSADGDLDPASASRFQDAIITALHSLGDYPAARGLRERWLSEAVRSLGKHHPEAAKRRAHLAMALWFLGQLPRAQELLEQALQILLPHLGDEHPEIANHRSDLALILRDLGELPRARELLERAHESALRAPAQDPSLIASTRTNLALVLQDLGELHRARELLELSLEYDVNCFGEDHPSVARERSSLALVLRGLGELPRARQLLEQALESQLRRFGEGHPLVAVFRANLAMVLRDLGEFPHARDLLERALASELRDLGEDHHFIPHRRNNLALLLADVGDLPAARDLFELVLSSNLRSLGEDHPSVALSRCNLASVLRDLGEFVRARELLEQALASNLRSGGEDHATVAGCRSNLALVLYDLGDLPRAKQLLERALMSDLRRFGPDHATVAVRRSNLALVLHELGEPLAARELLEQALASELRTLGENHPHVARERARLAQVLQALGDLPAARTLAQQALAADRREFAEDHANVAREQSVLAAVVFAQGDPAQARQLWQQALHSELRRLGGDHPQVALQRSNLARALSALGEPSAASGQMREALRAARLQPNHSRFRSAVERTACELLAEDQTSTPAAT